MRPHRDQLPLGLDVPAKAVLRPKAEPLNKYEIGAYVPTGKFERVFYIYNARTLKRVKASNGRRRTFTTQAAARKAADALERAEGFVRQ